MRLSGKKNQDSVSNFIEKTYNILESEENSEIVSWTPRGQSFIIKDVKKFQEYILPTYFKHSNFSSFVRQLNMYNFHKVRGDRLDCEFEHQKFKKGQKELLSKIKRKQSESFIISQNIIDEAQGNQSLQDSSQNIKKYSQAAINFENSSKDFAKQQSIQKNQVSIEELQNLRKQNINLRTIKQNKLLRQKILNTSNSGVIGQKFFKLITCLLAEKLQKQLRIQNKTYMQEQDEFNKNMSFDQIIQHILNNNQMAMEFHKYSMTAKTISSQQSDYDFMIRKANTNSQGVNGPISNGNNGSNYQIV